MDSHKKPEQIDSSIKFFLVTLIVTFGFVGKIKKAPGTFGSIVAIPIFIYIYVKFYLRQIYEYNAFGYEDAQLTHPFFTTFYILFGLSVLIFIIGFIFSNMYIKMLAELSQNEGKLDEKSEDPKEIVIDEVSGQLLAFAISFGATADKFTLWYFALASFLPFILFRFFDIIKPWPINLIDRKVKGGIGIMLDDIAAGVFAGLMYWAIVIMFV